MENIDLETAKNLLKTQLSILIKTLKIIMFYSFLAQGQGLATALEYALVHMDYWLLP